MRDEMTKWTAFYDDDQDAWLVRNDVGCIVADCGMSDFVVSEDERHARLIAAAPDLYEALAKSAEGWANAIELGLIPPQHVAAATVLRDEALAALARAQGSSNVG